MILLHRLCHYSSLLILTFFCGKHTYGQVYQSPLTGCLGVHDPVMIKEGDTYHIFQTGRLTPHKVSTDRLDWDCDGSAFNSARPWVQQEVPENNGTDYWAPDISFRDGQYWLYFSVSTFGDQTSAIGLATSPSLNNPDWTDQGVVITSSPGDDYNAIDPNLLTDAEGRVWMNWGSWWDGIFIIEIDPETGKPLDAAEPTHIAGRRGAGIEGSFIIYVNHYYYLFTSWDRCCAGTNSTYNIRVGRAEEITGPYEDADGDPLVTGGGTLIWDGDSRWIGPGHNGIFMENDSVFMVHHAYDANANGRSQLLIRLLYWTEDGWPSIDPAEGVPTPVAGRDKPNNRPAGKTQLVPVLSASQKISASLYDLRGRRVPTGPEITSEISEALPPGIYIKPNP